MTKYFPLQDSADHVYTLLGVLELVIEYLSEKDRAPSGDFRPIIVFNALHAVTDHGLKLLDVIQTNSETVIDDARFELDKLDSVLMMAMEYTGRFYHGGAGCIEVNHIYQCIISAVDRVDLFKWGIDAAIVEADRSLIASRREAAATLH